MSKVTKKGDILLVPICSTHPKCDRTAVLTPTDGWDEIKWESYAAYYKAKKVSAKVLQRRIESGEVTFLGTIPKAVFDKILKGIATSDETEPWFLEDYKASK